MIQLSTICTALILLQTSGKPAEATQQFRPGPKPINIVLANTEVGQALRGLSLRTGVNIIYSNPERLTLSLVIKAPNVEGGIRAIAAAGGLSYRAIPGGYVVAPPERIRQALLPYSVRSSFNVPAESIASVQRAVEQLVPEATVTATDTQLVVRGLPEDVAAASLLINGRAPSGAQGSNIELVPVRAADAATTAAWISSLVPGVRVTQSPGTSDPAILALTGSPESVARAKELLGDLAAKGQKTSEIVVRSLVLNYLTAESIDEFLKKVAPDVEAASGPLTVSPPNPKLVTVAAALAGTGGGAPATSGVGSQAGDEETKKEKESRNRTVVLRGERNSVERAIELLRNLDVRPKQVQITVSVAEVSPTLTSDIGVRWDWSPITFSERAPGAAATATRPPGLGVFSRTPFDFTAILEGMVQRREARVLARPSLQVSHDEDASVFIGDTIRARLLSQGAFGAQNVQIAEFPVGIILLLHPRIADDGSIHLRVSPVVSTVVGIDEDNVPQTSTREANTSVIVKDGDTIVLSGLIREEDTKTIREVPYLSRLPIIGELFRSRSTSRRRTELVISITPKIVP